MRRVHAGAGRLHQWGTAIGAGLAAILVLGVVQWYFAEFLLSEGARNFFFASDQWDYNSAPGAWQYEFWVGPVTMAGAGWAALLAAMSASVGLWSGNWMTQVRR